MAFLRLKVLCGTMEFSRRGLAEYRMVRLKNRGLALYIMA